MSPYDIYSQANIGCREPGESPAICQQRFTLAGPGRGVELSGGHHYGGYHYSIAIVDQNTSGTPPSNYPTCHRERKAIAGVWVLSDSNFKDIYGRLPTASIWSATQPAGTRCKLRGRLVRGTIPI